MRITVGAKTIYLVLMDERQCLCLHLLVISGTGTGDFFFILYFTESEFRFQILGKSVILELPLLND